MGKKAVLGLSIITSVAVTSIAHAAGQSAALIAFQAGGESTTQNVKVDAVSSNKSINLTELLNKIDNAKPVVKEQKYHFEAPVAGNAVVQLEDDTHIHIYSFNGMVTTKENKLRLTNNAWKATVAKPTAEQSLEAELSQLIWRSLPEVPSSQKQKGRYVTNAAVLGETIYLLGGYSTNRVDHIARQPNKQNISDFYSFDPHTETYAALENLPVSVDDTVMLPYAGRYLYVVAGWHKDGAINLVQVFDSYKNEWFQASPLPTTGVFGHAGGIYENQILFCDGQQLTPRVAQAPELVVQQRCWLGEIDLIDPSRIVWGEWVHPSDKGKFRMASVSNDNTGDLWFIGGSEAPFDLFGRHTSKNLSESKAGDPKPDNEIWRYNFKTRRWQILTSPIPVMDTPNAVIINERILTIGGRTAQGMTGKHIIHH